MIDARNERSGSQIRGRKAVENGLSRSCSPDPIVRRPIIPTGDEAELEVTDRGTLGTLNVRYCNVVWKHRIYEGSSRIVE
jgi:hypothetical protein